MALALELVRNKTTLYIVTFEHKFSCTLISHICGIILPRIRRKDRERVKGSLAPVNFSAVMHPHYRTLQMDKHTTPFTGRDTIGTIVVHPLSCKHLAENYL